jgi:branched-chain amino acid aminotransferase
MNPTEFIWFNGALVPWHSAQVHVLTHALHYGSAVFEGIRAYKTPKGCAIFRLQDHVERLFYSASALALTIPYTREEICAAINDTMRENKLASAYIRPLVYYGYGIMGINPKTAPTEVMVAAWEWGKYLPYDMLDLKVSRYIRIHPRSTVADAKISGHYVNSLLSILELRGTKYHEAIFLDDTGNIAEGPGENFFMMKNGTLITPPKGTILMGITRSTVIDLARSLNIPVEEKSISLSDALKADEAFYTGTAAEINPIRSIDDHEIGTATVGPVTEKIRAGYMQIVTGEVPSEHLWLVR